MLSIFCVPESTVLVLSSLILHSCQQKGVFLLNSPDRLIPKGFGNLLQGTANLEFWETYENGEIIGYLSAGK